MSPICFSLGCWAPLINHSVSIFISETCRDVLCPGSSTCVVDQTNNAYCVTCNQICPEPTSPEQYLCGNDGITYASACHLRKATCLLGRSIGLAYEGKCISKYLSWTDKSGGNWTCSLGCLGVLWMCIGGCMSVWMDGWGLCWEAGDWAPWVCVPL